MGKLTTHVLDTYTGRPAAGIRVELHEVSDAGPVPIVERTTGDDGRCTGPLIEGVRFRKGRYSLTFHVGEYFRARGVSLPDPAFLENVVVPFGIATPDENYHVPLIVTPWSYSVYRGS
ncbi:5-hydroxyisourate hydrolase [Povalibacter uvarum]|uniref:5-hydroxyisourate hydrolase n=1 Tax=Povalibacter uvarum TaxID=732238 RepID=A0A841HUM4_9GAMM|nr:hydroxyisourate hydrolase [Povalibacter uvarum]MBB6095535.1 5-hydroxyisourate hydrolase [Povalibacter uvarum]